MRNVKVKDAMTKNIVTAKPDESVKNISIKMKENNVGSLIIIDRSKIKGIVTYRDLVKKILTKDLKPSKVKVSDVSTSNPLYMISPDKTLREAATVMLKYDVKRLPVIKNGSLVGIISDKDILRITPHLVDYLLEELDRGKITDMPEIIEDKCEKCEGYNILKNVDGSWLCQECR